MDLIGLEGAPVPAALSTTPRLQTHRIADDVFRTRAHGGRKRFVWLSALRAGRQASAVLAALWRQPKPDVILVQNPPAVPTLAAAWLTARLRGAKFIIDWHNLSHTILAVRLGDSHRAVRALKRSERRWARRADAHLAVSQALAEWLRREWAASATVLYDRPPGRFSAPSHSQVTELWQRLSNELQLQSERLPLVVCPTSWTPDEDFDLLLDALERSERALLKQPGAATRSVPALALLMTGRGELRAAFEKRLARRGLTRIVVRTVWLEPDDYPTLVGMADLGLCLHQSSSGLDLPMKLADFRGAGVPVCAFDYAPVLREVLTPAQEGVTFHDPGGLATVLTALASGDSHRLPQLSAARRWLAEHPAERWEAQWTRVAAPMLTPERRA